MKSMSKRNKIILAAGGLIVMLAVVVAVVFSQQGGAGLFGSGVRRIYPYDPSIHPGQTVELKVVDAFWACDWTSSDLAIVSFAGDPNNTYNVTVQANAPGRAEIRAQCAGGTHGTTVVSVPWAITPERFGLMCWAGNSKTLSTGNPSTRWTLSNCQDEYGRWNVTLNPHDPDGTYTGPWVVLIGQPHPGSCTVTATTDGMADIIGFSVSCSL